MPYMTRNPRATFAFPKHSVGVTAAAVAVLLVALAVPVWTGHGTDNRAPDLGSCQNLRAGSGEKVALRVFAEGVQIYRWNGTSWVFDAPEALLFADAGGHGVVGTHYRGPTWETNSGGKVVAAVLDRCTPDPSAIPWLRARAGLIRGTGHLPQRQLHSAREHRRRHRSHRSRRCGRGEARAIHRRLFLLPRAALTGCGKPQPEVRHFRRNGWSDTLSTECPVPSRPAPSAWCLHFWRKRCAGFPLPH